jgi:selenocysteine-specific translation elongation factor
MIIATAGHIDHGKTTLVKALTGVDTDRLPEEKARGISIDIGFAYWKTPDALIGFVDVPGHERFIRNMLAGVSGIDYIMLIVAADDGVMPQTIEHLNIVTFRFNIHQILKQPPSRKQNTELINPSKLRLINIYILKFMCNEDS